MQDIYFISDLHLVETRPDLSHLLTAFLDKIQGKAQALYILGDWFATWTGDNTQEAFFQSTLKSLTSLNSTGCAIYFMPGNRDFLLTEKKLAPYGIQYLSDPTLISLGQESLLLLHGDSLCTTDSRYVFYRRFARHPLTQAFFLRLPIFIRLKIATFLRKSSKKNYINKPAAYHDVTPDTVTQFFLKTKIHWMLHGHVHRAGFYQHSLPDGSIGSRLVLGDWGRTGSIIHWDGQTFHLLEFQADTGFKENEKRHF